MWDIGLARYRTGSGHMSHHPVGSVQWIEEIWKLDKTVSSQLDKIAEFRLHITVRIKLKQIKAEARS